MLMCGYMWRSCIKIFGQPAVGDVIEKAKQRITEIQVTIDSAAEDERKRKEEERKKHLSCDVHEKMMIHMHILHISSYSNILAASTCHSKDFVVMMPFATLYVVPSWNPLGPEMARPSGSSQKRPRRDAGKQRKRGGGKRRKNGRRGHGGHFWENHHAWTAWLIDICPSARKKHRDINQTGWFGDTTTWAYFYKLVMI